MTATVGINLDGVTYYNRAYPFIDRMKTAEGWSMSGSTSETLQMNRFGYPDHLPTGVTSVNFVVGIDPQSLAMTDRYVLSWDGAADFGVLRGRIVSREAGKIVIESQAGDGEPILDIRMGGLDPNNPLRNMHLVREDQVALFNQGEVFNPDFVSKIDPFSTLRFMDWGRTNAADLPVTWNTRSKLEDWSWSTATERVPLEVMVKLANQTNNNIWYNIPFSADDDYVTHAVQYIRDNLKPGLKVHLEYANEIWNNAFPVANLARQRGAELGMDGMTWAGYRAAQVAKVARDAWGADPTHQLRTVLATQTGWQGLEQWHIIPGVQRVGDPKTLFDEYAVTTYFGASFSATSGPDRATIVQWAQSGEAGMAAAFRELEFGGTLQDNNSLVWLRSILQYQKAVADRYGWDLVAYEGGVHSPIVGTGNAAEDAALNSFMSAMINDPRMGTLYTKMVNIFSDVGGTELVAFNEAGRFWGSLDSIYQDGSPRYDALVAAARAATQGSQTTGSAGNDTLGGTAGADTLVGYAGNDLYIVNHAGDVVVEAANAGIDTVATALTSYTLADNVEVLTFTGVGAFGGTGNALDNYIIGGVGADTLSGGAGADTLVGGVGDDRYIVDNGGDLVVEAANGGMDRVLASVSYTLGANIEGLTLTGMAAIDGTGNALANEIYGNDAANRLYGGVGNDVLSGGAGMDILDGGDGADVLDGGAGADTMIGGAGNDVMMGSGADRMIGGAGDDTYYVDDAGDVVVELAGEGRDLVRATIDYTLPAEVERLWLSGAANRGTGNGMDNVLTYTGSRGVTISGLEGNDTLEGGSGADTLDGGAGEDRLTGGNGSDVLIGGAGRDILDGGAGADRFVIAPGDTGTTAATADLILGFSQRDGDRIDLSAFDAIPGGADDPFRFVGSAEFSRSAGELRAIATATDTMTVFGDTNGDGVADFSLLVSTSVPLVSTDFVL